MPSVKKAMRTHKPTKDDPPGTRFISGKKLIPYIKPTKPAKGVRNVRVGNYRADVTDDEHTREVFGKPKRKTR